MAKKISRTLHAQVNTERMSAEYDGSVIRSVRIGDADVDNGTVFKLGALEVKDSVTAREVHAIAAATAGTDTAAKQQLVLVCNPEVGSANYDERKDQLSDYYNVAGQVARAIILQPVKDTFAVTAEAFTADQAPAKGKFCEVTSTGKIKVVNAATNAFGEIIDVNQGFYGIHVL